MADRKLLAVIGTAGRDTDAAKINSGLYDKMYGRLLETMAEWDVTDLVSGGAAVADHLAVRAFIEGKASRLVLHLPAPFDGKTYQTVRSTFGKDAVTANLYHESFSKVCALDSFGQLARAISMGAEVQVGNGFKARNLEVADQATHLLALTFGSLKEPVDLLPDDPGFSDHKVAGVKDGGTSHTFCQAWKCEMKRHISLTWLTHQPR